MSSTSVGLGIVAILLVLSILLGAAEIATVRVRAQTAADAAALAAVSAAPLTGGDGRACPAARVAAEANGAVLVRCDGPGPAWSLAVEITVTSALPRLGALAPPVRARAGAVLEPVASAP